MLLLGDSASDLRRRLGPLAWSALEVLVSASCEDAEDVIVAATVRDVAAQLGVAKNTAHRALRALCSTGLATPTQRRDAEGRDCDGGYRLSIPNDVIRRAGTGFETKAPANRPTSRRRAAVTSGAFQLDLLSTE